MGREGGLDQHKGQAISSHAILRELDSTSSMAFHVRLLTSKLPFNPLLGSRHRSHDYQHHLTVIQIHPPNPRKEQVCDAISDFSSNQK